MAVRFSRETIYARDRGQCQYCHRPVLRRDVTYDHIMPRSRGGQTLWENIVIACRPCNQKKGNRTPQEAGMALALSPARPAMGSWQILVGHRDALPVEWRPYLGVE